MIALRRRLSDVFLTFPASLFFFLVAVVVTVLHLEVAGVLLFVFFLSMLLVFCDDITVTTLPFLLLCLFVLKCYDSFSTFIVYAPLAVVPIVSFIFHIVVAGRRFTVGKSFWGIVAVAIAVTLGGLFTISPSDYFSGTSLYYIAGLGVGMVGAYLLMKRELLPSARYSLIERLLATFYMAGVFGVVMLLASIVLEFGGEIKHGFYIQWSNNLSTLMMFFMPAPFYFALTRNRLHYFVGILFYLTVALTGSRGGFLMGAIELLLCVFAVSYRDKPLRRVSILTVLIGAIVFVAYQAEIFDFFSISKESGLISSSEPRVKLLFASFRDFLANPVFGRGIGYSGNHDFYNPVKGAANWYHMMIPQIIGSFGTVGILAYGYQFFGRMKLILTDCTWRKIALGLSYSGVLLMSQVNPGEFCPIPYQLLAVLLFILLELPEGEFKVSKKGAFLSLRDLKRGR